MSYTVLIIDDDASQGATILGNLQADYPQPVRLTWCKSYEEAFGPLFSGRWDMVLINLGRRQGNGAEVVERVQGLLSDGSTRTVTYRPGQDLKELVAEARRSSSLLQ